MQSEFLAYLREICVKFIMQLGPSNEPVFVKKTTDKLKPKL